jgi:hypothetical protein
MNRKRTIKDDYLDDIESAADRFGDHEGLDGARVLAWMANFDDEHLSLAQKVLGVIRYYSTSRIRAMTRELVNSILQDFEGLEQKDFYFVHVRDVGSSSGIIMRVLRDLPDLKNAKRITMADLEKTQIDNSSVIVFIDDFSGTGDQLTEWWEDVEPLVRPKNACIVVGLLVLNARAREKINKFAHQVFCVDELNENCNVLSNESGQFEDAQKKLLGEYCERTECENDFLRGYGQCGLLVAFKHGCPDDSLPILWYSSDAWTHLFKRSAL